MPDVRRPGRFLRLLASVRAPPRGLRFHSRLTTGGTVGRLQHSSQHLWGQAKSGMWLARTGFR